MEEGASQRRDLGHDGVRGGMLLNSLAQRYLRPKGDVEWDQCRSQREQAWWCLGQFRGQGLRTRLEFRSGSDEGSLRHSPARERLSATRLFTVHRIAAAPALSTPSRQAA